MRIKFQLLGLILLLASSCAENDVFFQYETIPGTGWSQDSAISFRVDITDTLALHNVYINVRNKGEYPHQNLWLFIDEQRPDSTIFTDTINFYLADQRGKWLGKGVGYLFEMPVLYQQQIQFPQAGRYQFTIHQGMRDSVLIGLNDIGLRIEKIHPNK